MVSNKSGFSINCKNVTYSPYGEPDRIILNGINFNVKPGEFVGIIGGNGAGKSTLLKAISGELEITKGEITVGGRKINEPINKRIDGVGVVHQRDDDDLLHELSVAMNVAFRQANNRCHPNRVWACNSAYKATIQSKIADKINYSQGKSLKEPDFEICVDQVVGHMSGGERQMLNIVIATHFEHIRNPCKLLLLDEHTSGLDPIKASAVMHFTNKQIKDTGTTAMMITHRYVDAIQYCDRIILLEDGMIKKEYNNDISKLEVEELVKEVEKI